MKASRVTAYIFPVCANNPNEVTIELYSIFYLEPVKQPENYLGHFHFKCFYTEIFLKFVYLNRPTTFIHGVLYSI